MPDIRPARQAAKPDSSNPDSHARQRAKPGSRPAPKKHPTNNKKQRNSSNSHQLMDTFVAHKLNIASSSRCFCLCSERPKPHVKSSFCNEKKVSGAVPQNKVSMREQVVAVRPAASQPASTPTSQQANQPAKRAKQASSHSVAICAIPTNMWAPQERLQIFVWIGK